MKFRTLCELYYEDSSMTIKKFVKTLLRKTASTVVYYCVFKLATARQQERNFILNMIFLRIFLTSTIFAFLLGKSHQKRLHENSDRIKEDYVEYERPKEPLSETIFHKKIRGLVYLPKTVPKWILDVIPFYGKNFKTLSSESSDYDRNLMSKVYEAPVKVSKGQLISKCPFGVFKSPKKPTKIFPGFLP